MRKILPIFLPHLANDLPAPSERGSDQSIGDQGGVDVADVRERVDVVDRGRHVEGLRNTANNESPGALNTRYKPSENHTFWVVFLKSKNLMLASFFT